jgi:hypothetical protein
MIQPSGGTHDITVVNLTEESVALVTTHVLQVHQTRVIVIILVSFIIKIKVLSNRAM